VVDLDSGREAIAPAPREPVQIHPDLPAHWMAWDVDHTYRHTVTDLVDAESLDVVGTPSSAPWRPAHRRGPVEAGALPAGAAGGAGGAPVRWVDGHPDRRTGPGRRAGRDRHRGRLARVGDVPEGGVPLDIRADRSAAETQFGYVYRATDTNTSCEAAKFEICAHRYLHVAEPGSASPW